MRLKAKMLATLAIPAAALTMVLVFLWKRKPPSNLPREEPCSEEKKDRTELSFPFNSPDHCNKKVQEIEAKSSDELSISEVREEEIVREISERDVVENNVFTGEEDERVAQGKPELQENCQLSSSDSQSTQHDSGIDTKSFQDMNGSFDDTQSEGSVDSAMLASFTEVQPEAGGKYTTDKEIWEIEFPQILCGRLIGRKGKNVKAISDQSGAKIRLIPQSPGEVSTHRIISLSGDSSQIKSALDSIHDRFPTVPLTRINLAATSLQAGAATPQFVNTSPAVPCVQTVLPSMVNVSVVVTSVIDAHHFFIQLHNDLVQRQLQQLHQTMMQCYGQGLGPVVNQPIMVGTYCAAPAYTYNGWYRSQVLGPTASPDEVEVKYLDYGGYSRIAASSLRQLRSDFLSCLPFQAVECYLANVAPLQGDSYSSVASAVLEDLTMNAVLTARVVGQQNQLPCLELYLLQNDQTLLVNRELVNRGLARWVES
ncbi:A-kinase anchor protein 1, mitochondrial [Nematostella vectensis]|uniref:A-kinase anchor protein 1, mitochondrial n=1 Tax=Nematostella vectensis TaxID=45351 RepID=UPI00138FB73B|nr:A-kinase anchor protein 1, mitochondrial [Nematostella vectensis]